MFLFPFKFYSVHSQLCWLSGNRYTSCGHFGRNVRRICVMNCARWDLRRREYPAHLRLVSLWLFAVESRLQHPWIYIEYILKCVASLFDTVGSITYQLGALFGANTTNHQPYFLSSPHIFACNLIGMASLAMEAIISFIGWMLEPSMMPLSTHYCPTELYWFDTDQLDSFLFIVLWIQKRRKNTSMRNDLVSERRCKVHQQSFFIGIL